MNDRPNYQIRPAREDDVLALSAIHVQVQDLHQRQRPDYWQLPDLAASQHYFETQLADNTAIYVLTVEKIGVVAYLLLRVVDEPADTHQQARRVLKIEHIAVDREHEGNGYGSALLEHAKAVAREHSIDNLQLSVWSFNERAIALYERHGFTPASMRMTYGVNLDAHD